MVALQFVWYAVGGIGMQIGVAAAVDVRVGSQSLSLPSSKWCTAQMGTIARSSPLAFAAGLPHSQSHRCRDIVAGKGAHNIDVRQRFSPSRYRNPATRPPMMFPEHYEHTLSAVSFSISLLPLVDYLVDLGTFVLGLSFFMFAASSMLGKPKEKEDASPVLAAVGGTSDVDAEEKAKSILTPETYADSRSAKQQVKLKVSQTASEAFESTDFTNEPHLSPELEDREAALEVALLANAAHELVKAAEKESRQSKAAMLEREKELEWIAKDSGAVEQSKSKATQAEAFQRSLLAAQLANSKSKSKDLLTPETYADSRSAKQQVKLKVSQTASEAFESTDFSQEPHLSPELEDREAAVEAALLANAAHELVEAAEKESRQSKAAMLEREKELAWLEKDADSSIQQSNESFQRSLLAAQLANEARVKELAVEWQLKEEEWMGSEARAASMGGRECVSFDVASAAATEAAAHALAEVEAKKHDAEASGEATAAAASMLAETAERMILGEDLALFEHSPEMSVKGAVERSEESYWEQVSEVSSNADQWRKDYIRDIKSYVQPTSSEQAAQPPTRVDSVDTAGETPPKDAGTPAATSGNSVIKRVKKGGIMRRVRQRRRFIIAALAVVIGRRLFLLYFGNARGLL